MKAYCISSGLTVILAATGSVTAHRGDRYHKWQRPHYQPEYQQYHQSQVSSTSLTTSSFASTSATFVASSSTTAASITTSSVAPSSIISSLGASSTKRNCSSVTPSASQSSPSAVSTAPMSTTRKSCTSKAKLTSASTASLATAITSAASTTLAIPSSTSASSAAHGTAYDEFLYGVDIAGWLTLDTRLNANLLTQVNAISQWTFDSSGSRAASLLTAHWDSYFNESSVQLLHSYGVNALKLPIGYWAYNNAGTPYLKGADDYLERAIRWARAAGMKVWIDLSNLDSQGSTVAEISSDSAITHSLDILKTVASKYGAIAFADTVIAVQIFPHPITLPAGADINCAAQQSFAAQALSTIRAAAANQNLQVIFPDDSECATSSPSPSLTTSASTSTPTSGSPLGNVGDIGNGIFSYSHSLIDSHLSSSSSSQKKSSSSNANGNGNGNGQIELPTQAENIAGICATAHTLLGSASTRNSKSYSYVGSFSAATPSTMRVEGWTSDVVSQVRKYVEAQLEVYEKQTRGFFFWSWTDDDEEVAWKYWGFKDGVNLGYIPVPLNDKSKRKYPGQCQL